MLDITLVRDDFVAEIAEIDLSQPPSPEMAAALRDALDRFAVLVIPNQSLTEEQQLCVTEIWGPAETALGVYLVNENRRRRVGPQLSDISNLDENGELLAQDDLRRLVNLSNQLWHTDSSFKKTPASASLLYSQEVVPTGGATEFADMRAAWDALDDATRSQIKDLVATHDYFYSRSLSGLQISSIPDVWRERQPPVKQVLVRKNERTGRRSLYLASHIERIEGLAPGDSSALLERLMAFATQPQFTYRHRWRPNDLVIWDNRSTMHRGTPFNPKYRRNMRRGTAQDAGPTVPLQ